ncbi:uncharacterized protein LOC131949343 [Physella acuta]|uniref:uncharacterized protein LOC131949343 n=1 Tax=Physella acuta TaxID=109671 RepID=UPI0027DD68DB|nr:uncharacterized protein LOC131949343 [Physella acuta]XP_059167173.1 uncharacterized protein LOC131949343 [Physella acuta]XP_059167175.1 uncharacterized protein LOC131949343 [Physella acuta]
MVQDITFKQYFWLPKSTIRLPEKIDQSKKSVSVKDLNNSIILSDANSKIVPLYQKKRSQDKPVKLINKPNTSETSRYLEIKSKYQTEEAKCDHKKVNTLQLAFENLSNQPREKSYSFKSEVTQVGLPNQDTTEIEHRVTESPEYKKDMYHEPNIDAERRNSLTRMEDHQKPEIQSSCKLPAISLGLPELPSGLKTTKPFVYKNTHFDFTLGPVFSPPSTVRSVITDVINTTDKQSKIPNKNESPSIKLTVDIPVALSTFENRAEKLQFTRHLKEAKEKQQLTTNFEKQENDVCSEKSRSMESFNSLDQWPIINEYEYDSSTSQIKLGQNLRYSSKGIKLRQSEDFGTDVNQNPDLISKDEKMKVESPAPPPPSPESKVQRDISAGD